MSSIEAALLMLFSVFSGNLETQFTHDSNQICSEGDPSLASSVVCHVPGKACSADVRPQSARAEREIAGGSA